MLNKIKQEAGNAMGLIGMISVSGDAVDVMAAARQALRNIMVICDATEPPAGEKGDAPDEAKGAAKNETA
jgi:hypothetical protein